VAVPDFVAQPAASRAMAAVMARAEKGILKLTVDAPLSVLGAPGSDASGILADDG
jgi:hypothetical protein